MTDDQKINNWIVAAGSDMDEVNRGMEVIHKAKLQALETKASYVKQYGPMSAEAYERLMSDQFVMLGKGSQMPKNYKSAKFEF